MRTTQQPQASRSSVKARLAAMIAAATLVSGAAVPVAGIIGTAGPAAALEAVSCAGFNQAVAGTYTCAVPDGVTSLDYVVAGGNGGGTSQWRLGGSGARISGTLTVAPGDLLSITVGGTGQTGFYYPGGGGGYSSIATEAGPIVIAGGGGGSGASAGGDVGGNGGTTGSAGGGAGGTETSRAGFDGGTLPTGGAAGYGGFAYGGAGGALGENGASAVSGGAGGGGAGFGGTGGAGASSTGQTMAGGFGGGGNGGYNGGGGGGGYGGGGGGGTGGGNSWGTGGGGGSSLVPAGATAIVSTGGPGVSLAAGVTPKTATTTILAQSSTVSYPGQQVTYTATVTPASGTLDGGTVAFDDGGATITACDAMAVDTSTGQAACMVTYSEIGTHSISAIYSGTDTFETSSSDAVSHEVQAPSVSATSTVLAPSAAPSLVGAQVTYAATVSPAPDGGTVEFLDGVATIAECDAVAVVSGVATCDATHLSVGTHSISAVYSGTAMFETSTASPIAHDVTYGLHVTSKTSVTAGGRSLTLKVQLVDANGVDLSSSSATLTTAGIDPVWTPSPSGDFTFVTSRRPYYEYTLIAPADTLPGTYVLTVNATGDPISHEITIKVPSRGKK